MSFALSPTVVDAAALADELVRARLFTSSQIDAHLADFSGSGPVRLAEFLVERGVLTEFQAHHALRGEVRFLVPGPYRLQNVLRTGTLGPVYRATHTSKTGEFAIKLLPIRSLWQARQAKKLTRSFVRFTSHPGVLPLIDADSASSFHYLVWPATNDVPLIDRIASRGPIPFGEAAAILSHMAEALTDCHARNLPHGALSPWAVGLGNDGQARLLDFGVGAVLAQNLAAGESLFDTLSTALTVAGMLDYAAPELVADPTAPSALADLYSLGAVGFFALTGRLPFSECTLTDRLIARQNGHSPLVREVNPDVPIELGRIIDRLLQPNPTERFHSADEVWELLAHVAEECDSSRPVMIGRDSAPLIQQHAADAVDHSNALSAAPQVAGSRSGSISWAGSGITRPAERDDSDASIQFELPPGPTPDDPGMPFLPMDTPRASQSDTDPDTAPLSPRRLLEVTSSSRLAEASPTAGCTPALPRSPAPVDATKMAKPSIPESRKPPEPPLPTLAKACSPDPRLSLPTPVQWHTNQQASENSPVANSEPAAPDSVLWKKLKRNLLFWQAPTDPVSVSVFGPPTLMPGKTVRLTVFLHHPDSTDSVKTLSRAFQHDAELIGSGQVAREVARESLVAIHLTVTNAAASRSLMETVWRGQPLRLNFDLHVPWESPGGDAPGLVSVGQANIRIGKATFNLHILPRRG